MRNFLFEELAICSSCVFQGLFAALWFSGDSTGAPHNTRYESRA